MRTLLPAIALFYFAACAEAQIVFNEIGIAPSGGNGEFIELYNRGNCSIDISCYTLIFSSISGSGNPTGWTIKIPSGKFIGGCSYFLIGGIAGSAGVSGGTGYPNGGSVTSYPSADLNIGTVAFTANAVFMKQQLSAGTLPNSGGQLTLLDNSGTVVTSLSYNNGNNTGTYPLSSYTTCNAAGNTQGSNNIFNPGSSPNNVNATFTAAGNQGIYLNSSGNYVTTSFLTPGLPNPSQLGCPPAITLSTNQLSVCAMANNQTIALGYTSTINTPTHYSITWNPLPANSFAAVVNAGLQASLMNIIVPGGTAPGNYIGYLTVSNTSGTGCPSVPFTITVNPLPAVSAGSYGPLCAGSGNVTLTGLPAGGIFSGTGVSGNNFTPPGNGGFVIQYSYTDAVTGCSESVSTSIVVHPQPVVTVTPSSAAICENSSGVSLAASGGNTYTWNPSTGLSSATGSNVIAAPSSATSYTVTGTDANGCSGTAVANITVLAAPVTPQVIVVNPTCVAAGSIHITSPQGSGFSYSIDGVNYLNNNGLFTNVAPGAYAVTVKNAEGCVSAAANVVVNLPPGAPVAPLLTVTQPNCINQNGSIQVVSPAEGTGFTYSIDNISFQSSAVFGNLTPGSYSIWVKSSSGCISFPSTVTLNPPPAIPPAPTVSVVNNCDGTSVLTANGFSGTLVWSNGANSSSITVSAAGNYSVTQTINGCTSSSSSGIASPALPPPSLLLAVTQPGCTTSGSISITSPLGAEYLYSINGSPFTNTINYTGLNSNTYIIHVKNAAGCEASATTIINPQPVIPVAPVINVLQPGCMVNTGSIIVTSPAAGYSIDNSNYTNTSGVFTGLLPGIYHVTVQNNAGCISPPTEVVVNAPPSTPTVAVNSPVICTGSAATMVASALPAGNYTYVWTVPAGVANPGNVASFTASVAGTYSVTITNSSGCSSSASGTLSFNPLAVITADDKQVCSGSVVSLTGQPAGGTWTGISVSGSQFNAAALSAGQYIVTYTYTSGSCSGSAMATITVNSTPDAPSLSVVNHCNGTSTLTATNYSGSLLWGHGATTPIVNVSLAGTYSVTQTVNSCESAVATVMANPYFTPAAPIITNIQQPDCTTPAGSLTVSAPVAGNFYYSINGIDYTNTTGLFIGLAPGNYSVSLRNNEGCTSPSIAVTINAVPLASAAPVVQTVQPDCLITTGSVTVQSPSGAGFEYSIDGTAYQPSSTFSNLVPGSYLIRVRNDHGCISASTSFIINQPSGIITTSATACIAQGTSYNFNGQHLTATGNYATTYARPGLCDSTVNLYLLVSRTEIQTHTGCTSYTYNGITYFSSVTLRDTIVSSVTLCDSLYRIINIIINSSASSNSTICLPAGATYNFNGIMLTASGQYTTVLTTSAGCDSTVHLQLTIMATETQQLRGCESVSYNGSVYTSDTLLTETILSQLTGCDSVSRVIAVLISPKPKVIVSPPQTICRGDTLHLTASAANATVEWIGFGTGNSLIVSPFSTTTYTAVATSGAGCTDTGRVTVSVFDFNLQLSASPNPVIAGKSVQMYTTANATYRVVSWHPFPDNQTAKHRSVVGDTTIMIKVAAQSTAGCSDADSIILVVNPLDDVYIPTAFTPNGDSKNERFVVAGEQFSAFDLKIFNRWGELIFHTTKRSEGWDGKRAGRDQPAGTYVYALIATLKDRRIVKRSGTIALIR